MDELISLFIEWADIALNWLYNFFTQVWGYISDWWSSLRSWIEEQLLDSDEVVLVDGTTPLGREIVDKIKQEQPNIHTIDGIERKYALTIKDDDIAEVSVHEATPEDEGLLEKAMEENDGILRIK